MKKKRFQKRKEDFSCEHCGAKVVGSGYTNHCPLCLWSKHVDVNPGDRAAKCAGMMEPIGVEGGRDYVLIHRCRVCGIQRRNIVSAEDSIETLVGLAGKVVSWDDPKG